MVDQENSSFCELDFFIGLGDEFFSEKFIQFFSIDSAFFYIISICSESEHHLFDLYLFTCEYFFIVYFSSEVFGKWRSIVPSCSCLIARSRKSKSSIWWVIPIWLIVFAFVSWTWEIREFIVMPVFSLKISQNLQKFFFYFSFRKGICFPVFWIFFIFEYIGAGMAYASELCVEISYVFEYFSWFRIGKSEDEVDIYRDSWKIRERFPDSTQRLKNTLSITSVYCF